MRVLTAPEWLAEAYNNQTNEKGTAKIVVTRDVDGKPIIGKSILTDSDWDLTVLVQSPEDGIERELKDYLTEIEYKKPIEKLV